ncbi:MAG: hypothetical protein O2930_13705 [Acidobacteria bacterium]|nr:hypothetical protein [Acidobacteriota bacterium]
MTLHRLPVIAIALATLIPLDAAVVSREGADILDGKIDRIRQQGAGLTETRTLRTQVSEDELNSWFMYRAQPLLPEGLTEPHVTFAGDGVLTAQAIVDLESVMQQPSTGGGFDPLSLLGGKVPVTVTGVLRSGDGVAHLEVQTVLLSGFPVPVSLLQELATYYSRTPERPMGIRLGEAFELPAGIRRIDVGPGQAVVVQ